MRPDVATRMATKMANTLKAAALPVCLAASVGLAATVCLAATEAEGAKTVDTPAAEATESPAAPAAKPFDPAVIPEVAPPQSPLGYRFAELTPAQTSALRRGFKLPLDALASAKSPSDLARAVVVAPLPDPSRPLLAVSPATESLVNPFADEDAISFRRNPMKALGAMLGGGEAASASPPAAAAAAAPAEDDPFGMTDAAPAPADQPGDEVAGSDDPFGAEADPFAGAAEAEGASTPPADDEDPFGDF